MSENMVRKNNQIKKIILHEKRGEKKTKCAVSLSAINGVQIYTSYHIFLQNHVSVQKES